MSAKDNVYILRGKILALLQLSATDPDTMKLPDDKSAFDSSKRKRNRQDTMFEELRILAMQQNTMLGRIMRFQCQDADAIYVVTHMKKNVAILKWVDYCDGWQDDRLGLGGPLPLSYVRERIERTDKALATLVSWREE